MFEALSFGDVFDLTDVVQGRAGSTAKDRGADLDVNDGTILAEVAFLEHASGNLAVNKPPGERYFCLEIVGMRYFLIGQVCEFLGAVADDFAENTIDANKSAIQRN